MKLFRGSDPRRVAFAVVAVIGAMAGHVFALRRLRELPDFRETHATIGRVRRVRGKSAAGSGRAGVIDGPISDVASPGALANIFCGDDVAIVRSGDAGAVNAGAESSADDGVHPGVDVSLLRGQHAPALLLIEKDDGMRGKAFSAGGGSGGLRVRCTDLLCVGHRLKFGIDASVEENEEAEARRFDGGAVSCPGVGTLAGRIVEPVASVGKSLVQSF